MNDHQEAGLAADKGLMYEEEDTYLDIKIKDRKIESTDDVDWAIQMLRRERDRLQLEEAKEEFPNLKKEYLNKCFEFECGMVENPSKVSLKVLEITEHGHLTTTQFWREPDNGEIRFLVIERYPMMVDDFDRITPSEYARRKKQIIKEIEKKF